MNTDLTETIENEWYVVRHSGETPEIAYNSAIYYLTRAKDGPHVCLTEQQINLLKDAAVDRYTEIVLRDLQHVNCSKSIYRGIGRSIINYRRFCMFCVRQHMEVTQVRSQAAEALQIFIDTEIYHILHLGRSPIINCTFEELQNYAVELGVALGDRFAVLEKHCSLSP